jgi:phosphate:Na+ symporter
VVDNFQLALNVFVSSDVDTARQLIQEKEKFRAMERESSERHIQRLRAGTVESIDSSPIHLDVIRDLAQINSLLSSTAYPILEDGGHLHRSRLRAESPQAADGKPARRAPLATRPAADSDL